MYRRPKFLEILLEIRQEMAREADFDADLFIEMIRSEDFSSGKKAHQLSDEPEKKPANNRKSKTA